MASSDRHRLDKSSGFKMMGDDADHHRQISNGNNNGPASDDDDDSENECWDDAKALLQNDDDTDDNQFDSDAGDGDNRIGCRDTFRGDFNTVRGSSNAINDGRSKQTSQDTIDGLMEPRTGQPLAQPNGAAISASQSPATVGSNTSSVASTSTTPDCLALHEAVFNNDPGRVLAILNDVEFVKRNDLVNKRDKHGNTALHLACMMGRSQTIINALLHNQHGFKWSIDVKNLNRWTPFHEACSYGNRDVITLMARQLKDDVDDALSNSKLSGFLEKTKDYRLVLKWEFQSWVPFVSRVLPSDVCVIIKQGKYIRVETRLVNFEGFFRKKGDSCLVYSNRKWIVMDNKAKKYQYFETPSVCRDVEEKVDEFMATDIMDLELKSSEMQLIPSTSGWIWKANKVGKVGRFSAALYDLNNVFLVTRKRREHLSEDDLKRNKNAYKSAVSVFKYGERPNQGASNNHADDEGEGTDRSEPDEEEIVHRESLPPPPPTKVTWREYIESEPANHPNLGREQKCKIVKTAVKASVAMSEEFPLSKKEFLDLLSIVPIKMFKKLKEFVEMKLPEGFPVRLDIPVFPFLTARITFEDFAFHDGPIDESLFNIPPDYELDTNLLPGRFNRNNNNDDSCAETNGLIDGDC